MALAGLVSLAEPFLNQTAAQPQLSRATTPNDASIENGAPAAIVDKLKPSTQNTEWKSRGYCRSAFFPCCART
jgi:hypothetical protein